MEPDDPPAGIEEYVARDVQTVRGSRRLSVDATGRVAGGDLAASAGPTGRGSAGTHCDRRREQQTRRRDARSP
jgi:hypothetical protein